MVQSLSDCICSSTRRQRAPSFPLLLLRKMFIPLRMQAWHLHQALVDFRFYTSTTAGVLSIGLIPVNQEVRSPITLISVPQKHRLLHSEEAPPPRVSLTKVVTLLLMPSWPQWMSITFLIAGMHHIRILLPLEILGHPVLPQILTHAIRRECVVRLLMTRIIVVPLAMVPCHLRPPFIQLVPAHQLITVILPTESFPAVLPVLTALLMHTPGSRVVMAR
jgi:hypothetical protein